MTPAEFDMALGAVIALLAVILYLIFEEPGVRS